MFITVKILELVVAWKLEYAKHKDPKATKGQKCRIYQHSYVEENDRSIIQINHLNN